MRSYRPLCRGSALSYNLDSNHRRHADLIGDKDKRPSLHLLLLYARRTNNYKISRRLLKLNRHKIALRATCSTWRPRKKTSEESCDVESESAGVPLRLGIRFPRLRRRDAAGPETCRGTRVFRGSGLVRPAGIDLGKTRGASPTLI